MKFQSEKKELWRYASKNLTAPVHGTIRQLPLPHRLPPQLHLQSRELPMTTQSSQLALLGCCDVYGENSASTAPILRDGNVSTPPPPYSSLSELDCSNSVTVPDYTLTFRQLPTYRTDGETETSSSATESETNYSRVVIPGNRDGCRYANSCDLTYIEDYEKLNEINTSSSYQLTTELQKKACHISPLPIIPTTANPVMLTTTIASPTTNSTISFAATAVKILRNCCGGTFGSSNTFTVAPSNINNNNSCNKTICQHQRNVTKSYNYSPEQYFNTLMKQLKASQISSLLKAVKSRQDQIFSMPVPSSMTPSPSSPRYSNCLTNCILLRRAEILGEEPYVIVCRLFFWRDLKSATQLKRLPVCPNERDPVYVCCNPLHWCRILETESTQFLSQNQSMEGCEGEITLNDVKSSTDSEYDQKNYTDVQQRFPVSVTTDGEGQRFSSNWCEVAYWEMAKRVGERYPANTPTINIFSDKPYAASGDYRDGMCLRELVEKRTTPSSEDVRHTRQKIGLGITLSQDWDGVWLYNRSSVPIFVYSPTLTESWFRVCRVEPGNCLRAFDKYKALSLVYPTQFPGVQTGPIDKFSMCISFGKGWGFSYKRPNITLCPCWLEVFFKPQR